MTKWTPVIMEWLDAHGGDEGWGPLGPKTHRPEKVRSVGMLFKQDDAGVTIVMSKDSRKNIAGYLFVPAVNVVSVRELA